MQSDVISATFLSCLTCLQSVLVLAAFRGFSLIRPLFWDKQNTLSKKKNDVKLVPAFPPLSVLPQGGRYKFAFLASLSSKLSLWATCFRRRNRKLLYAISRVRQVIFSIRNHAVIAPADCEGNSSQEKSVRANCSEDWLLTIY